MYLDKILAAQKRGEAKGITSVCSAHPYVIHQALKVSQTFKVSPLIDATCNQVNQFGGYTGMTPKDFVAYARGIAKENDFPFENIILGGDHLGPSVWQNEPAESAMQKAEMLIRDYVDAGFTKIHLDCSMKLADDPDGALDVEVSAQRAARLAKVAETVETEHCSVSTIRYVIGTEVPIPGGATEHENGVSVTNVEDARQTIEVTREAFYQAGLQSAWERVAGVVVQPGVEFGDDFVLQYQPEAARELSKFIESQRMIYEAHSTDYQTREALKNLVRDHFAILKVGPALTFAFREAVFALAMMEEELKFENPSRIREALETAMLKNPAHWQKHYHGNDAELKFARQYSFSDRIRYYWTTPEAQTAFDALLKNLSVKPIPLSLISQYLPTVYAKIRDKKISALPRVIILSKINDVLEDYMWATR